MEVKNLQIKQYPLLRRPERAWAFASPFKWDTEPEGGKGHVQ
jgi:hypothetical protein